jgi:hypothetical protein
MDYIRRWTMNIEYLTDTAAAFSSLLNRRTCMQRNVSEAPLATAAVAYTGIEYAEVGGQAGVSDDAYARLCKNPRAFVSY